MVRTYVLDASAVLDFVEDGPGAKRVELLFQESIGRSARLLISAANWGELFYHQWQERGEAAARRTIASLSGLQLNIVPVDFAQALKAGEN
jgi:hypothetical protein